MGRESGAAHPHQAAGTHKLLNLFSRYFFQRSAGINLRYGRKFLPAGVLNDNRRQHLPCRVRPFLDRKSTRLNSSDVRISYAVFCLKKKKNKNNAKTYAEASK